MVKGSCRQVILMPLPDPELFDQAIFILKADALGKKDITDRQILHGARQAAGACVPSREKARKVLPAFWAGVGTASTGLVWLVCCLI